MEGYEVVCVGNFTKDTIITAAGTTVVGGGGFNYGCHAARALGRRTAAVTRLAACDRGIVDELEAIGVEVFAGYCEHSTCLTVRYPGDDPDDRILSVTSLAEPIGARELAGLRSRAFVVGTSLRGEVSPAALEEMAKRAEILSIDVQGFLRVEEGGALRHRRWEEQEEVFALATIVKCDAEEARFLTGSGEPREACRILFERGAREIVLTDRAGVTVFDGRRFYAAPFRARSLGGRSGRGDTCVASYVAVRLEAGPAEAIRWAAALTSLKLERPGPFRGSREEVARLLAENDSSAASH